ncbi:related to ATP dependent RNA helicase [Fusarium fujikuroi]|nr:related to ATP dependent RNA helicase [Fusarium fujikuroi]SCO40899.1 related to ATP dependent RNA helicase [Fusarium fujikuroi]
MAPPTEEQLLHQSVVQYEVAKYNPLLPGENRSDSYLPTLNEQCRRSPIMQTENFDRFLKLYKARQVVVVNSDTGSEDSRQLVKRIMYLELNKGLKVVCTQAHEDAARELGQRVSAELEVKFGEQVGVQYRNYNKTSDRTRLYFVTEGMLRKQVGDNPNLAGYSCVILDFQGQTTNNNHLVGLLKQALALRFDLKLVIMAATESERLAIDFGVPKVLNLDKDSFSVVIQYMPEMVPHYCEMALSYVKRIHDEEGPGDILVFLGSAPQVDRAVATLRKAISDLETFPLHDRLSEKEKAEALQSSGEKRRCVVTTNIAESDITVNGISYVVDSGVQMDPILNPRVGMETLRATLICKQSADQRAKCAGRTQSGICQRLYTIVKYNEVLPNVQSFEKLTDCFKTGLLALRISGADIKSIYTFDFIDPANEEVYLRGLENLRAMNLIDENGTMTPAGEAADKLPLSINPIWHNAFEEAIKLGCLSELIDIAALVSVKNICLIPPETLHAADVLHEQFMDPLSDHLSELNALYAYLHRKRNMSTEELAIWCHETFLNSASLEGALEMRQELIRWCKAELGVSEISFLTPHDKDYHVKIRKAIAKGFIHHAATKDVTCHQRQYITLENIPVILFYRSAIGTNWKWVVYHRIETTAPSLYCMDRCTVVEENWLLENDYFYPTNLPKDDNGKVRVKRIQILFDILNRPYQP